MQLGDAGVIVCSHSGWARWAAQAKLSNKITQFLERAFGGVIFFGWNTI
jgi:hypothetical protein